MQKIWNLNQTIINNSENIKKTNSIIENNFTDKIDSYILRINSLINKFQFNVVIANFYEIYRYFFSSLEKEINKKVFIKNLEKIMLTLVPFVPHLANECLQNLNTKNSSHWPKINKETIVNLKIKLVVQINGKTRDVIEIDRDLDEKSVINIVKKDDKIQKFLTKKSIHTRI